MTSYFSLLAGFSCVSVATTYDKPFELFAVIVCSSVYTTAFVTNTTFYLVRKEQRPEWLYSVMWFHDFILGFTILIPIQILSSVKLFNDAHMRLLCKSPTISTELTCAQHDTRS